MRALEENGAEFPRELAESLLDIVQAMAPKTSGVKRLAEADTGNLDRPKERFSGLAIPNMSEERVRELELEALGSRPVADPGIAPSGASNAFDRRVPPPPPPTSERGGRSGDVGRALAREFSRDNDERALVGKVYVGRVSNVMEFGCFVQLEGVRGRAEGLVHISLIQSQPLRSPHDAVKRGQKCFVKVRAQRVIRKLLISMRGSCFSSSLVLHGLLAGHLYIWLETCAVDARR